MEHIWLDLIVVGVIVLFVFIGYKRGAARSLANLCGTVISAVGSVFIGSVIAKSIYALFVKGAVINKISAVILEKGTETAEATLGKVFDSLPDYVRGAIESFGFSMQNFLDAINLDNATAVAEKIETMVAPIITTFISVITITVLFIALRIVLRFVVKFVEGLMNVLMLSFVNSLIGAVIGLAEGLIFIIVFALILKTATPLITDMPKIIAPATVENTFIFRYLYNFDFLNDIQNFFNK